MRLDELRRHYRASILSLAARHRAGEVRVFGSVARGTAGEKSDIDLLVTFAPGASLLDEAALDRELKLLLDRPVDLVAEDAIRDEFRPFILQEAVPL